MSHIHDQIRAVVAKAEARALKTYSKKLAAEEERHRARLVEIERERDAELEVARAALKVLPEQGAIDDGSNMPIGYPPPLEELMRKDPIDDDEPDLVSVPASLAQEYTDQHRPKTAERLTGKGRAK